MVPLQFLKTFTVVLRSILNILYVSRCCCVSRLFILTQDAGDDKVNVSFSNSQFHEKRFLDNWSLRWRHCYLMVTYCRVFTVCLNISIFECE